MTPRPQSRTRHLRRAVASGLTALLVAVVLAPAAQADDGVAATTAAHDFDGDGNADVLAVTAAGDLMLYPGNGASGWHKPRMIGSRGWNNFDLVMMAGDVDDDGANDVLARLGGDLRLYRGNGAGGLVRTTGSPLSSGWDIYEEILPMDGNGDGYVDLYAMDKDGGYLWLYPGREGAAWRNRTGIATGVEAWDTLMGPGDTNGDGYAELDFRHSPTGRLINVSLKPNGTFQHSSTSRVKGTSFGAFTALLAPGDFSGDGYADTIARFSNGDLYLYKGTSAGTLTKGVRIGHGWNGLDLS